MAAIIYTTFWAIIAVLGILTVLIFVGKLAGFITERFGIEWGYLVFLAFFIFIAMFLVIYGTY